MHSKKGKPYAKSLRLIWKMIYKRCLERVILKGKQKTEWKPDNNFTFWSKLQITEVYETRHQQAIRTIQWNLSTICESYWSTFRKKIYHSDENK